jgi:hypothetical protein
MDAKLVNMKIKPDALRLLRLIAATTGEKQYAILQRLLTMEWTRVQSQAIAKES